MTYTPDYFIAKFSAIPEDRWRKGGIDPDECGRVCVLGHLGLDYAAARESDEAQALAALFRRWFEMRGWDPPEDNAVMIWQVNDGDWNESTEEFYDLNPRAIILKALTEVKEIA